MSRLTFFLILFLFTSVTAASAQSPGPIAGSEETLPQKQPEAGPIPEERQSGEISFYDDNPLSAAEAAAPPVDPDEGLRKILENPPPQKAPVVDPTDDELRKILENLPPQKALPAPVKPVEEAPKPVVLTSLTYGQEIETTDRDGNKVTGTIDSAWFDPVHGLMYFVKLPNDEVGVVDQNGKDAEASFPPAIRKGHRLET